MIGKALIAGAVLTLTTPAIAILATLAVGSGVQHCVDAAPPAPAAALAPDSSAPSTDGVRGDGQPLAAAGAAATATRPGGASGDGCLAQLGGTPTGAAVPVGTPAETAAAVRTSLSYVGVPSGWTQLCDKLACRAYGYANSGYTTARAHWLAMLATGHAHPGDACPPLGSFVFFDTGRPAGHVSLVVAADPTGCDPNTIQVTANEVFDRATGNHGGVYELSFGRLNGMYLGGHGYLGWSDPVCAGALLTATQSGA